MTNISERLKSLRKEKQLTQKKVAEALEINEHTYRRYEASDMEPSATNINKIADYFEISTDYLLGRTDDPTQPKKLQKNGAVALRSF